MSEEPDSIVNSGCSEEDNKSSQDSLYVHGSPSSESLDPEFAMDPTFSIEELGRQASAEDAEDDNLQRSSITFEFQSQGVLLRPKTLAWAKRRSMSLEFTVSNLNVLNLLHRYI